MVWLERHKKEISVVENYHEISQFREHIKKDNVKTHFTSVIY